MRARYIWGLFAVQIVIVLALLFFLVPKLSVDLVVAECGGSCVDRSAWQIASQLGRLDAVSLSLAFLGIGVGSFAIFSFFAVKDEAERIAKRIAKQEYRSRLIDIKAEIENQVETKLSAALVEKQRKAQEISTAGRIEEKDTGEGDNG